MTVTEHTAPGAPPPVAHLAPPPTTDGAHPTVPPHWSGAPADSHWLGVAAGMVPALAADAERLDRTGEFPQAAFGELRRLGITSMLVPAELGGGGATRAEACAVLATLARGCPSTSLALSMHLHLVAAQVWRHRRGLPAPLLPRLAEEHLVLVSTGAADWLSSGGTAVAVEGGFRVSGRKAPSSGAPAGDVLVTSIRWDDAPGGPQVVHASVPFSAAGVHVEETWDAVGMRATGSHTVVLDDVFVPEAAVALVRPADSWHPVWATVIGAAMPLIMATYVGVAETAAERALDLAHRRAASAELEVLVGRMVNRLTAARDAVRRMIDLSVDLTFDPELDTASAVLVRRTAAAEAAIDTVRLALEVGGGAAYTASAGMGRLLRDVMGSLYHPLPTPRQERFSGRVALGLEPVS